MNPYLLAAVAIAGWFLLRGRRTAPASIERVGAGAQTPEKRPVVGDPTYGGILFSGAEDALQRQLDDALRRIEAESAARREALAGTRVAQSSSVTDAGVVKQYAMSPPRRMTDFGV